MSGKRTVIWAPREAAIQGFGHEKSPGRALPPPGFRDLTALLIPPSLAGPDFRPVPAETWRTDPVLTSRAFALIWSRQLEH